MPGREPEHAKRPARQCRTGRFLFVSVSVRRTLHVLGGGTLLALHHVELHGFTFVQRLVAAALDSRVVHEAILLATLWGDEAKTLVCVEPLDCPFHAHTKLLSDFLLRSELRTGLPGNNK